VFLVKKRIFPCEPIGWRCGRQMARTLALQLEVVCSASEQNNKKNAKKRERSGPAPRTFILVLIRGIFEENVEAFFNCFSKKFPLTFTSRPRVVIRAPIEHIRMNERA
jgi:hypothetical protein